MWAFLFAIASGSVAAANAPSSGSSNSQQRRELVSTTPYTTYAQIIGQADPSVFTESVLETYVSKFSTLTGIGADNVVVSAWSAGAPPTPLYPGAVAITVQIYTYSPAAAEAVATTVRGQLNTARRATIFFADVAHIGLFVVGASVTNIHGFPSTALVTITTTTPPSAFTGNVKAAIGSKFAALAGITADRAPVSAVPGRFDLVNYTVITVQLQVNSEAAAAAAQSAITSLMPTTSEATIELAAVRNLDMTVESLHIDILRGHTPVYAPPPPSPPPFPIDSATTAIAGGVIGGLVALMLVSAILVLGIIKCCHVMGLCPAKSAGSAKPVASAKLSSTMDAVETVIVSVDDEAVATVPSTDEAVEASSAQSPDAAESPEAVDAVSADADPQPSYGGREDDPQHPAGKLKV